MALHTGVQQCVAASTSGRHCCYRPRHFAFPVCDRLVESARLRSEWRGRLERVVPYASLTMDAPARSPPDGLLTTVNNISVSPLPRPQAGGVKQIHSEQELKRILAEDSDKLTVLECKSASCRPCKMFIRKYARLADAFPDCLFLEITGDESLETRQMMMKMKVKVTPTFRFYRRGKCVNINTGVSENLLREAVERCSDPDFPCIDIEEEEEEEKEETAQDEGGVDIPNES